MGRVLRGVAVADGSQQGADFSVAPPDAHFKKLGLMRPLRFFQSGGHHRHVLRKNIVRRAVQFRFELLLRIADNPEEGFIIPEDGHLAVVG